MRFWDSSAIVPTLLLEPTSSAMRALLDADIVVSTCWASEVECASAIARCERAGELDPVGAVEARLGLDALARAWIEVPATDRLRAEARRLVSVHDLGAADALQLAAARMASDEQPATLELVTLDERLATAARREGFPVLP